MKQQTFFDINEVEITLTYPQFGVETPITFYFGLLLSAKEKEIRQRFFGLSPEEQDQKRASYNLEMLCSLATRAPENLPTFTPTANGNVADDLKAFFAGPNAMKAKVVEDAINAYFAKTQPLEFFR